jgi:hypothetical protein
MNFARTLASLALIAVVALAAVAADRAAADQEAMLANKTVADLKAVAR